MGGTRIERGERRRVDEREPSARLETRERKRESRSERERESCAHK